MDKKEAVKIVKMHLGKMPNRTHENFWRALETLAPELKPTSKEEALEIARIAIERVIEDNNEDDTFMGYNLSFDEAIKVLKEIKKEYQQPRTNWIPSSEQLDALGMVIRDFGGNVKVQQYKKYLEAFKNLKSLREDLELLLTTEE